MSQQPGVTRERSLPAQRSQALGTSLIIAGLLLHGDVYRVKYSRVGRSTTNKQAITISDITSMVFPSVFSRRCLASARFRVRWDHPVPLSPAHDLNDKERYTVKHPAHVCGSNH